MAKNKSKAARRQQAMKEKLAAESMIRQNAALITTGPLTAANSGMSLPFCTRSASNTTSSVNYRPTAHPVHFNQLPFSVGGSNHVQWVSGVGVLLWSQHT